MQRFTEHFNMRKEWYKVARYFLNTTIDDFVIAEIETKDNDVSRYFLNELENGHYYFLFKKDNKDKPIVYPVKVDAEALIKFAEGPIGAEHKRYTEDV